jgi:hypothetical protein
LKIIHSDCDPILSKNKSLPIDSYLVSYMKDGLMCYDVVHAVSKVEIFDYYYDTYGKNGIQDIKWTDGSVNTKLWSNSNKKSKK